MPEDLYKEWLGVPSGAESPDHYALLGLKRFCKDLDRIETAVRSQMDKLDQYALHPNRRKRDAVQRMMNEVAQARICLVNSDRKHPYDLALAAKLGVKPPVGKLPQAEVAAEVLSGFWNIEEFEDKVRDHLRKWRWSLREEGLLLAEAANYGIDDDSARITIRRIDAESEQIARRKAKRWNYTVTGVLLAAFVAVLLVIMLPRMAKARRRKQFDRHMQDARLYIDAEQFKKASDELALARQLDPDSEKPAQLQDKAANKLLVLAVKHIDDENHTQAKRVLDGVRILTPDNSHLADLTMRLHNLAQQTTATLLEKLRNDLRLRVYAQVRSRLDSIRRLGVAAAEAEAIVEQHRKKLLAEIRQNLKYKDWSSAVRAEKYAEELMPRDPRLTQIMDEAFSSLSLEALHAGANANYSKANRLAAAALTLRPKHPDAKALLVKIIEWTETPRRKPPSYQPTRPKPPPAVVAETPGRKPPSYQPTRPKPSPAVIAEPPRRKPPSYQPTRPKPTPAVVGAKIPQGKIKSPWFDAVVGMTLTYKCGNSQTEKLTVVAVTNESAIVVVEIVPPERSGRTYRRRPSRAYPRRRGRTPSRRSDKTYVVGELSFPRYMSEKAYWRRQALAGEVGSEDLEVSGRSLQCDIYSRGSTKTWICPDLPGWIVRRTESASRGRQERTVQDLVSIGQLSEAASASYPGRTARHLPSYRINRSLSGYTRMALERRKRIKDLLRKTRIAVKRELITPDGNNVLTLSGGLVRTWNVDSGRLTGAIAVKDPKADRLVLDSDGKRVMVIGRGSNLLSVWEIATGKPLLSVKLRSGTCGDAVFWNAGKNVLVITSTGPMLYNVSNNRQIAMRLTQRNSKPISCDVDSTGQFALLLLPDGNAQVYDLNRKNLLYEMKQREAPLILARFYRKDGKDERIITIDADGGTALWDGYTGHRLTRVAELHSRAYCFSPDGQRVVMRGKYDSELTLHDTGTGAEIALLSEAKPISEINKSVTRAIFSPDSRTVLSTTYKRPPSRSSRLVPPSSRLAVALWDSRIGRKIADVSLRYFTYHKSPALIGGGDKTLVSRGNRGCLIVDTRSGRTLQQLTTYLQTVRKTVFGSNGTTLLTLGEKEARLWEIKTGRQLARIPDIPFGQSVISPNSDKAIISSRRRGPPVLLDLATGRQIQLKGDVNMLFRKPAFSRDGRLLLAGNSSSKRPYAWNTSNGVQRKFRKTGTSFYRFSFSPNNRYIVGHTYDEVCLWNIASGRFAPLTVPKGMRSFDKMLFTPNSQHLLATTSRQAIIWDIPSGRSRILETPEEKRFYIRNWQISPDSKVVMGTTSDSNYPLLVWKTGNGKIKNMKMPKQTSIYLSDVAFGLGGKAIVAKCSKKLFLWDVFTGNFSYLSVPRRHYAGSLTVSPNGKLAAATIRGSSGGLVIWNLATKRMRKVSLPGQRTSVHDLIFTPQTKFLMAHVRNGILTLNPKTGRIVSRISQAHQNLLDRQNCISSDGRKIAWLGQGGILEIFDLTTGKTSGRLVDSELERLLYKAP